MKKINNQIEHRITKVGLVTSLSTILSIVLQLASVPICLKYWGQDPYGQWLALSAAFSLLRSVESGYVVYIGNNINLIFHKGNKIVKKHLSSALFGIILIGVLQLILVALVWAFEKFSIKLGLPIDQENLNSKIGLTLMMVCWVFSGAYFGLLHKLMIPAGLMYESTLWGIGYQLSNFLALIASAYLKFNMLNTSILFSISQVTIYLSSAIYLRYKLPDYYPWWKGGELSLTGHNFIKSSILSISNLLQQGLINGPILLITILVGPIFLPLFTTARTLANLWVNITTIVTAPLVPDIVRLHVNGEVGKIIILFEVYWVVIGGILNVGIILSYFIFPIIFSFWTNNVIELNKPLLYFLLASVLVSNFGGLVLVYMNSINNLFSIVMTSFLKTIIALIGGYCFYKYLGLASFGLSIFIGELFALIFLLIKLLYWEILNYKLKIKYKVLIKSAAGGVTVITFLLLRAFDVIGVYYLLPFLFTGIIFSSMLSWKDIENNARLRLVNFFKDKFSLKKNIYN